MKIARNSVSLWFDWGQGCAKSVSCTRLCFFMSGLQRRVLVCLFEEACRLLIDDLALKLLLGWEGLLECSAEAVDFLKTVLNCLVSVGCSGELAKQRSAGLARLDPSPVVPRSTKSGHLYEELDGCCNCLCSFPLGVPIKGHYSHPVKTV